MTSTYSLQCPLGFIQLKELNGVLSEVSFMEDEIIIHNEVHPVLLDVAAQIKAYFNKKLHSFDIPIQAEGTDFQKEVWRQLTQIPYGKTISYAELSEQMNHPKAIRAIAAANGQNPIGIIIPCHRVIGSDGSLTGYAGGLWRKHWLIDHEQEGSKGYQTKLFK